MSKQEDNIEVMCRTLKEDDPLREQALAVLADPAAAPQNLQPVRKALFQPSLLRRTEREVASWLIAHAAWSEEQQEKLSEALSQDLERALKAGKPLWIAGRWVGGSLLTSQLLLLSVLLFLPGSDPFRDVWEYLSATFVITLNLLLVGVSFCFPIAVMGMVHKLRALRPAIAALGKVGRADSLAILCRAGQRGTLRDAVTAALADVTARLTPADYATLSLKTMSALCQALTGISPPVTRVILRTLTVVGDGRAVRAVKYLAQSAVHPDIRESAARLLPLLQQRAQESKASAQLLRASGAPEESGRTLLRAARELDTTDSAQLLRLAASPGSDELS